MTSSLTPRFQIVLTAILFSTGGTAIKASELSIFQIATLRNGIAALAILLLLPAARRISWRSALVGLAYAGTTIAFTLANRLTTAGSSVFLEYTAPLYVLALSPWLLRERIDRRGVMFLAALAAGLALVLLGGDPPAETASEPFLGKLVALGSGLFYGLMILGLRLLGRNTENRESAAAAVLTGNALACLICLPFALPMQAPPAGEWLLMGYLGVVQIALAYVFFTAALRSVPAFESSLILLLDPVFSPIWAWWVHGEGLGGWTVAGGAVILAATAGHLLTGERGR